MIRYILPSFFSPLLILLKKKDCTDAVRENKSYSFSEAERRTFVSIEQVERKELFTLIKINQMEDKMYYEIINELLPGAMWRISMSLSESSDSISLIENEQLVSFIYLLFFGQSVKMSRNKLFPGD